MFPFKPENNVCHKSLTWQNLVWKNLLCSDFLLMLLHWTKPTDFDHFTNKLTKYLCTFLRFYIVIHYLTYILTYIVTLPCYIVSVSVQKEAGYTQLLVNLCSAESSVNVESLYPLVFCQLAQVLCFCLDLIDRRPHWCISVSVWKSILWILLAKTWTNWGPIKKHKTCANWNRSI